MTTYIVVNANPTFPARAEFADLDKAEAFAAIEARDVADPVYLYADPSGLGIIDDTTFVRQVTAG